MKGIEFLKKIGHVEEAMISEAANPIKKSKKWNGNMIKFAGLAACITIFVGAICAGRAGIYLKKSEGTRNSGPMSSGSVGTKEEALDSTEISEDLENLEESATNQNETLQITSERMVMLEGRIYVEVGESDIDARCGMMDGSITSSVESGEYPKQHNQSNFGSGYGYQNVGEDSIDVNIDGQWIRFETSDSQYQEEPFGPPMDFVGPENEGETARPARLEVSLNTQSITSEGAEFLIINLGYQHATTGKDFRIEKLENGNWLECDYVEPPAWEEIALILESDKETVFYADWSKIYGSLEKGTYRFRKTININGYGEEVYCEFTL